MSKHILLVNPWICDFSAYDLWMFPAGLSRIAAALAHPDVSFHLVDFLDRNTPEGESTQKNRSATAAFGTGHFRKKLIAKPPAVAHIQRPFYRYGVSVEGMRERLCNVPVPDLIFVTSGMTYWYRGVQETIALLGRVFPGIPIVLGGIYATLMPEHARRSIAVDQVFIGNDFAGIAQLLIIAVLI